MVLSNTNIQTNSYYTNSNIIKNEQSTTKECNTENTNWFKNWLDDKDKVCTDGNDNGKLSVSEALGSFGKGLMGIVKSAIKHPIATGITIAAGAALTIATGGAALPILVGAGALIGTGQIGYGAYKAFTADTDGEAKQAFETMGNGTFAVAASALSAKGALNAAAKAGVSSAEGAKDMNALQATVQCIKSAPQAIAQSAANIKGNYLTLSTGVVHANSNALRNGQVEYMSKANEVKAYRFNPNGSESEILKNNPGVFKNADGQYCIPNKWSPEEPYIIDTTKEQMIMMYGSPDDMAVCDGNVFKGSYVDSASFKSTGELNYQNPADLKYNEILDFTKQAKGAFNTAKEGTKVQTLEGVRTVGKGDVIAIDHTGSPYVTTAKSVLKRNIPIDTDASRQGFETLQNLIPKEE